MARLSTLVVARLSFIAVVHWCQAALYCLDCDVTSDAYQYLRSFTLRNHFIAGANKVSVTTELACDAACDTTSRLVGLSQRSPQTYDSRHVYRPPDVPCIKGPVGLYFGAFLYYHAARHRSVSEGLKFRR